ncbi:MAG: hypothetical protein H6679_01820 [Epsilonproteobacteria bacterium]|nr:hypothetical protein [Campylobacterota bacterium]
MKKWIIPCSALILFTLTAETPLHQNIECTDPIKTKKPLPQKTKTPKKKEETKPKKRWTVDRIVARVNGVNILQSDLDQPRIAKEGDKYSIDEAIMEELMLEKAKDMHVLPTNNDIERQFIAFKIQNGFSSMTDEEFEKQLLESGFSLRTYKHQLGRMMATENIKRAEIMSKIFITKQDVEKYYSQNPEYEQERYNLKVATLTAEELKNKDQLIKEEKISFNDLGWVDKSDVNQRFESIFSLEPKNYSQAFHIDDKYQILYLVDKTPARLKTLDERYSEIERSLQNERKMSFLQTLENDLKKRATIVIL